MAATKAFIAVLALSALTAVSAQTVSVYNGTYSATTPNNALFTGPITPDPCTIGPSYWCLSDANMRRCQVYNVTVGVCGYSSGKCNSSSVQDFCAQNPTALRFNGGLTNAPPGKFGYYALALYWAPTSCSANSTAGGGFCSSYTLAGTQGSQNLVLHGLWTDYGSLYTTEPAAPAYNGSYQGWNQYCSATGPGRIDYSRCHVNGGLCPWANATAANFTQSNYEQCMRANGVTQCQVEEATVSALQADMARYAPGFLGADRTFLDHEFFKHASCVGGYLTDNKTAFFETAIGITKQLTANGSWADVNVHQKRGTAVDTTAFVNSMNNTAIPQCDRNCQLSEVWYCYGRDAAGFPTELITCPIGTLGSNNCKSCPQILIPDYSAGTVRRIVSSRKLL
ncbi:hypothetical protein KFL_001630220 [Klebsormidium nitens]|uniref:Saposin A-type domain-containing protein n=1 Tax=Klebsormidium nitens TaxID=105231 RepID=A0A1Y1HYW1_KLENI|nr:hypothetical protein KFL_001630220 [Klebsormidium nitens]|eukprot:GAQ83825.1 hypothetical protein KFL_001630220 [Klebsormidium nitens]